MTRQRWEPQQVPGRLAFICRFCRLQQFEHVGELLYCPAKQLMTEKIKCVVCEKMLPPEKMSKHTAEHFR